MVNTAMSAKALRNILVLTLLFSASFSAQATQNLPFKIETVTAFDEPWAMAFLPNGHRLLGAKAQVGQTMLR